MSQRKAKTCTLHKDLKPVTAKLQRSHHSYTIDQETTEKEIGKGDVDWFSKASRQSCKQRSQKIPQPTVTPLTQKFNHDIHIDCSPIDHAPDLLESQFSTISPLTAWMPPSLGRSPVAGTAQQYGDSQFDLVKSLGINDSTLSWTSSLATPNNDDVVQFKDKKTPVESKKRSLSRMLFSPGLDMADDISMLNNSYNKKTEASSKNCSVTLSPNIKLQSDVYNGDISTKKTKTDTEQLSRNKQNIKANLFESWPTHSEDNKIHSQSTEHTFLDNTNVKVESKEPLEDALSDFFDPPSKAAGRRRSAPSYRRRSQTNQDIAISKLSKSFTGCDSLKDSNLIKSSVKVTENCTGKSEYENSTNRMSPMVTTTSYSDDKIVENHNLNDLNSKETSLKIKYENELSNEVESNENDVHVVSHGDIKDISITGSSLDNEGCSQVDLFCSTPIDVKRSYKSILSTSKKKTPMSKKRVRFTKDIENDFKKELCENNMSLQGLKVESSSLENNGHTTTENFTPVKNKSEYSEKDNNILIQKEGSKEIQEDLFSQVSPTVLEEMCSIVSDKSSQMSSCLSVDKSQTSASKNTSVVLGSDKIRLKHNDSIISESNPMGEKSKADLSCNINNTDRSNQKGNTSEVEKSVALETNSYWKKDNNILTKSSKVKRFFYPTNSQINKSCPKSVFGFKHEVIEVKEQVTSYVTDVADTVMSGALSVTPTTSVETANKSSTPLSVDRTGWRNTGKSTTESGFKRYSELVKEDTTGRRKTPCTEDKSSEYTSRTKQGNTPLSSKRDSSGLTSRRLCLKEYNSGVNNDGKQFKHHKQCEKEYFIDAKDIVSASSDTNSRIKVKAQVKENKRLVKDESLKQKKCEVEDTSFDELQDDSFAKEISMDGTLEKLSCSSLTSDNIRKVSPDSIKNSFIDQYKQNLKILEKVKEVSTESLANEKCDIGVFQGFLTAAGSKINITKDNMTEQLMDSVTSDLSVEFSDDLTISNNRLKMMTSTEAAGEVEDVKGSSISSQDKNRAKMLDVEVKVSKNNSCMMKSELESVKKRDNGEEHSVRENEQLTYEKNSNSKAAADFEGLNRLMKPLNSNSEYRKTLPSKSSSVPVTEGFTTASGKGLACSVSSLSKAKNLFTDIQDQIDADGNSSLESDDKNEEVLKNRYRDSYTGSDKLTDLKNENDDKKLSSKNEVQEKEFDNKSTNLGGFSTASGNGILISTSSLSKAEKFIREAENEAKKTENSPTEGSFFGKEKDVHQGEILTTSLEDASQSSSNLSKTKCHTEDIENEQKTTDKSRRHVESKSGSSFQGFSAASGKNIPISISSLDKAKSIIKDIENMNTPINIDIDKNFDNSPGKSKHFNGQCGFQTASGKNLKLSSSSLLKADSLMKAIENHTDIPNNNEQIQCLESAGKDVPSCRGFSSASGKNLEFSTSSLSKAQGLMKDLSRDVTERDATASKKEQFENIFKDLVNQHSTLNTIDRGNYTEQRKLDAEKDVDLEKELESMLKQSAPKVNIPTKPTKSSRFPPGANIPKGFRPFKAPKLICKPKAKAKDELDLPKSKQGGNLVSSEEVKNKQTTKDQDPISYGNDHFDNSLMEDVFSDEMLPSQKFSPRSGRPIKKSSTCTNDDYHDNSVQSYQIDYQKLAQYEKTITGKQSNTTEKDMTDILGNQGDSKITTYARTEHEIDFKGDNTQFSLEDIMDLENEFTQVLEGNQRFSTNEGACLDPYTNVHTGAVESSQNIEMSQKIGNPFQSASGKLVCVSEKALQHARGTLNDDNSNPFKSVISSKKVPQYDDHTFEDKIETLFENTVNEKDLVSDKGNHHAEDSVKDGDVNEHQSESDQNVTVPGRIFEHKRNTVQTSKSESKMKTTICVTSNPFQSASGKSVHVSEKALQFARQTLNDENLQDHNPFQSASGKSVPVSEKALQFARQTWNDDNLQDHNPFQSASGESVLISEKALLFARQTLIDENLQGNSINPFQSASGMSVHVSEKALQIARHTLNDENLQGNNPFQSASGKSFHVSEKALQLARQTLNDDNFQSNTGNPFQSASGKSVNVSEKALQFARQTLNDENIQGNNPFQSASGKNVHVSEKALKFARQTLNDENLGDHNPFQSAAGKSVHVSENALQFARQTLKDEKIQNIDPFQSASGKNVHVSQKALQFARHALNDKNLHANLNTSHKSTLQNVKQLPDQKCNKSHENEGSSNTGNSSNDSIKRKRIDFEDDFDVPLEILEQMEMYGKKQKMCTEEARRKPMSTVPEDYRCDRQFSGFSPKPLKSQSARQRTEISEYQSSGDQIVPPKSTFKTPFKLSTPEDLTKSSDIKMKVATPVFIQKTSAALEDNLCNQMEEPFKKAPPHKFPVRTFDNQQKSPYNLSHKSEVKSNNNNCLSKNNSIDINKQTVNMIQKSRKEQMDKILQKSKRKVVPVEGRLYQIKQTQRRFKLKDVISLDRTGYQRSTIHVQQSTKKIRCSNAALHRFYLPEYYGMNVHHIIVGDGALLVPDDSGYAGKEEFYQAFLTIEGVDSKLVDDKWFYNHYRWVIWKLASYEVASPEQFGGRCLTPEVVMLQMKYRYDREIDKCQRSAIMKICERDDTPCKRMVLCVSEIKHDGKETQVSLTDGWYSMNGKVDSCMASLINRGCIQTGHKLCISGAELIGSQNACPPLEAPESLLLRISTNSTRPAPWDTKLGYQTDHTPFCVPLSSLHGEGGIVGCVDVIVVRKYPTMYMEKLPAGGCVFRSYAAEEKYKQSYQQIQQERMEKLYLQLESQFEKDNREDKHIKRKKWSRKDIDQLSTGLEIYEAVNSATHADDIQSYLSDHQIESLTEHQRIVQDEKRQKLNAGFQKAWNDGEENHKERKVIPLMKIRIVGCCRKDMDSQLSSLLTIWRPTAAHTDLTEGKRYKVYSLSASSARSKSQSGVQLTATKQTQFKPLPIDDNILDLGYETREVLTKQDLIRKKPPYGEADVVGIVIEITSTNSEFSGKQQDMVYIADINDDFVGVKFWGGVKYNGMSDTVQEGAVCYCCNLCDKSTYPSRNLPVLEFSSELSVISQSPQYAAQRKYTDKLKVKLKKKSEYINIAKDRLNEKLNGKNILAVSKCSPEKMNPKADVTTNSQTPNMKSSNNSQTPNMKSAPKMAALLSYSSPSPLSPLVLSSTKSIHKAFKPPTLARK